MAVRLSLDRPTRRRLLRLARKTRDAYLRVRCWVVLKVATGVSCAEAARAQGCASCTAARIVARFAAYGEAGLLDRRSENGSRKVDPDGLAGIARILEKRAPEHGFTRPTWTLELLRQAVERVLEVVLTIGHLWKLLRRIGARWGRPRPVVACPWKAARRARYLAGAYDPLHQRLVYVEGDRKASWPFLNLLRALLDAYRWARTIHLILDNFIIHKSQVTQTWLRAHGAKLRLHFLPPYCPDENRIERLWQELHANVTRNHLCRTMVELMRAVHRYLAARFELAEVIAYAA